MRAMDITDIQLVNRKSKKHLRGVPETTFKPTKAQVDIRVRFAEITKKYAGKGLSREEIAKKVKEEMEGYRSKYKKIRIPKYVKRISKVAEMEHVSKEKMKKILERIAPTGKS